MDENTDEKIEWGKRWWTLVVLCLSLVVTSIGNTSMNLAIPRIVGDLHASGSQLQWMIDGYVIVFASLLLVMGALGDRFGRKRLLHAGVAIFGAFSALAAFQTSPTGLIAARALMGVGAAMIFPTTLSILTNVFSDPRERAKAIGIWSGFAGVGVAVGPLGAGFLLEHFSWGSVFLINVPLCAVALLAGIFVIPDSRDPDGRPLDPLGSVLSVLALVSLLFAIIEGPDMGWRSTPVLTGFGLAVVFFTLFVGWELRTEYPVLDIRFFRSPRFSAASLTITLTFLALYGSTFLVTQYFQFVLGYSPIKTGFLTAPVAVGIMIGGPNAPRFVNRFGTKRVVTGGLSLLALCLLSYSSNTIMSSLLWGSLVRLGFGFGLGFTTAPATESIMGSLPPARAGVGSAVNDTTRQAGGALGVAFLGSLFAARYRHAIAPRLEGLPADAVAAAHDSIGRALGWAETAVDGSVGAVVHDQAVTSFLDSMRVVYPVAAAVVGLAIVVTLRYLPASAPPTRRGGEEAAAFDVVTGLEDSIPEMPSQVLADPAGVRERGPVSAGRKQANGGDDARSGAASMDGEGHRGRRVGVIDGGLGPESPDR